MWEPPRPSASCTFDVMEQCTLQLTNEEDRRSCVEGARDAHLQVHVGCAQSRGEAYVLGWNSAVVTCPIQLSHR